MSFPRTLNFDETFAISLLSSFAKAKMKWIKTLHLAIWAGAFIAFASYGSTMAAFNLLANPETYGLGRCLAGCVFPIGLMLVIMTNSQLFTGNTTMIAHLKPISPMSPDGKCHRNRKIYIPVLRMLKNWFFVYIGNFIGAMLIVLMIHYSGLLHSGDDVLAKVSINIAYAKTSLSFLSAFVLGIMCNWLVCLAIWFSMGTENTISKLFSIYFPIWLFITSGFEHSIANMYYIPIGILSATEFASPQEIVNTLTWSNFCVNNLLPVTLGNIVGGGFFVGFLGWVRYPHKS